MATCGWWQYTTVLDSWQGIWEKVAGFTWARCHQDQCDGATGGQSHPKNRLCGPDTSPFWTCLLFGPNVEVLGFLFIEERHILLQ